ncbi:MAG: IS21-like element helper ATPase IstB [Candidatus Omnitrophota bacterium]|nr:IS21-like element helper ATPase IstB [Candidatus Omnitrophota bacterium]
MNVETLQSQLRKLWMTTAARELEEVLTQHQKAASLDWVSELLEREIDARQAHGIQTRIRRAGFPKVTALESFDWTFNPKIDRKKIEELASLEFMKRNRIALFLGAPGVGKTHVAIAIGVRAAKAGARVFWATAKGLIRHIALAKAKNNLDELFKRILSSRLWIIEDWGVISMNREVAEDIFDLLDRRTYSSAMILTSNRDVKEWAEIFPDPVLANATIDRIFDRAEIVTFEGHSYRLNGKIEEPEHVPDSGVSRYGRH